MKIKAVLFAFFLTSIVLTNTSCSKGEKSLENQLNDLENIIEKYEPKFKEYEYGSQIYKDMIPEYNKEIADWGSAFENDRYERGADGKMVSKQEFKDVEKRFYELNGRMTRMVLATIPKKKKPITVDIENSEAEEDKQ
ncbi:MAG: hypothetical protein KAH33_01370 [Candidatus Delongbacteria bacterium]|nr:hypothetical protein [Candidatus Delongbacteria bacterium]